MIDRKEPTVTASAPTSIFDIFGGNKQSAKSHEVLMSEALQSFTTAQQQLERAQSQIQSQVEEHERQVAHHAAKAEEAGESLSRLARVAQRIQDILA